MTRAIDGFYAAYLAAAGGNGLALLVFRDGIIAGADLGGVKYDGRYIKQAGSYRLDVTVSLPANAPLVQGITTGPTPNSYVLDGILPANFLSVPFVRISGKYGPVNTRFVKLRDLTE